MKENPRQTGRGGTTSVVGERLVQMRNARKIRNLQKLPHPAFSHLLPHGEGQIQLCLKPSLICKEIFNQDNLKTLAQLGEGGPSKW